MLKLPTTLATVLLATVLPLLNLGCNGPDTAQDDSQENPGEDHHAHPTEGPHGGELIELGNEDYHAELLHPQDHAHDAHAGEHEHAGIVIHILDGSATKPVRISAAEVALNLTVDGEPKQFKLVAQSSDADGKASEFASSEHDLLEFFHENEHVELTLVVVVEGKSFRGTLAHDHGDDSHGDSAKPHDESAHGHAH
jgi:hypothetical protein